MKARIALVSAIALLALTGCASAVSTAPTSTRAEESTQTVAANGTEETSSPESSADVTAPGQVCDPGNANDVICAAFYPDQAVLNIAARNDGLSALGDDVVDVAKSVCDAMRAGSAAAGDPALISAASLAYCPEFSQGPSDYPDLTQRRLAYYQSIGEEAARAEFANGTMPTPDVLGY
ncbi:hypothetical protein [Microbacterium sp. NPDC087592]|uniref:hypothetical protein n=1 Tax=Microbacterium sp. NPDC087592 TaxID=3364193 RepID=UPI003825F614